MQNQLSEVAARASDRAISAVENLILNLSMRLAMLRNTIAAITLAAYERPEDLAKLDLPSILESLTALLPDDAVFTEQLAPVADAFMSTLMQAAEAERQHAAVPPEVLKRMVEIASGADVNRQDLEGIQDAMFKAYGQDVALKTVLGALYAVVYSNGIERERANSKTKGTVKSSAKAPPPTRKRERLTAGAA